MRRDGEAVPGELLDELARVVATPGEEPIARCGPSATDLVEASGRDVPDDVDIELRSTGSRPGPPPRWRSPRWRGQRIARPDNLTDWVCVRTWDDDWGMQVVVRPLRGGVPHGAGKPLWLRRHRAVDGTNWHAEYDWCDDFGMPHSQRIYQLGADLLADALGRPGLTGSGRRYDPLHLVRHFNADVLW